jgi:hypothetical protein
VIIIDDVGTHTHTRTHGLQDRGGARHSKHAHVQPAAFSKPPKHASNLRRLPPGACGGAGPTPAVLPSGPAAWGRRRQQRRRGRRWPLLLAARLLLLLLLLAARLLLLRNLPPLARTRVLGRPPRWKRVVLATPPSYSCLFRERLMICKWGGSRRRSRLIKSWVCSCCLALTWGWWSLSGGGVVRNPAAVHNTDRRDSVS